MNIEEIHAAAVSIKDTLGLRSFPVGVSIIKEGENTSAPLLSNHRYCQALMRARHGEAVSIKAEGLACPAAARAFDFRPLPEKLASGEGLVGFGIVREPSTARTMFEGMTVFSPGEINGLELFPLEKATRTPDVIVVEDEVENLMWIALAALNVDGGERVRSSTAILQATCVDSFVIPFKEDRLNLSYGCYGCRDATDMQPGEAIAGFPWRLLKPISEHLEYLGEKAIPASRSKRAYSQLRSSSGNVVQCN